MPVQGAEALSAALQRRGWEVVLYGGEGPLAVPSRKALEIVRIADPHLPFIAVSPHLRRGNLSAILRGVPDGVPSVPDLSELHNVLTRELEQARMRRRVGGAHRLLAAQQAIADHLAAGLEPDALCDRVLSTLGESLGWHFGAVWRPDGAQLRCASLWQSAGARAAVSRARRRVTHDRRPTPPARASPAASGPSAARSGRASCPARRSAPAWSPRPRSRSRSATSASA